MEEPSWIINYRDIISEFRLVLYKFEFFDLNFQGFINEINKSLIHCGYDPVNVIVSDTMTELFGAYSVYVPSKPVSRIYVSTELLKKPRTLLGRVLMHEVFHHVLFQKPPSPLFKLAPRRTEPLILITIPLLFLAIAAAIFRPYYALPYIVVSSAIMVFSVAALLIKALSDHELAATALVIYLITGRWIKDWVYYHSDDALMSLKWYDNVKPREIVMRER